MTEIGGVFNTVLTLSNLTFTTLSPPTGEQVKITFVQPKTDFKVRNSGVNVCLADGSETDEKDGFDTQKDSVFAIGSNHSFGSTDVSSLQPVYITDSQALYLGNDTGNKVDVVVQGVRVA